jgi:hypothetical protein
MRRNVARVLIITMIAAIGLVAAPTLSAPAAAHQVGTNGCSGPFGLDWLVPDQGVGWNFHDECDGHDLCYRDRWYKPASEPSRAACDTWFYNAMARECAATPWWAPSWRYNCYYRAELYFHGVRQFGSVFYWSPDLLTRANTRMV